MGGDDTVNCRDFSKGTGPFHFFPLRNVCRVHGWGGVGTESAAAARMCGAGIYI